MGCLPERACRRAGGHYITILRLGCLWYVGAVQTGCLSHAAAALPLPGQAGQPQGLAVAVSCSWQVQESACTAQAGACARRAPSGRCHQHRLRPPPPLLQSPGPRNTLQPFQGEWPHWRCAGRCGAQAQGRRRQRSGRHRSLPAPSSPPTHVAPQCAHRGPPFLCVSASSS